MLYLKAPQAIPQFRPTLLIRRFENGGFDPFTQVREGFRPPRITSHRKVAEERGFVSVNEGHRLF